MTKIAAVALSVCVAGCQTAPAYEAYANALARAAEARADVARAQAAAIAALAREGDATTKTVAVLMLAFGANTNAQTEKIQPPVNEALQWASILLPSVTTLALGWYGWKTNVAAVNANSAITIASYDAITGVAGAGFGAVGQFKPAPFDWSGLSNLRPNITTVTNTRNDLTNEGNGAAVIGDGTASVDNRVTTPAPVVVPPVVPIVPVVVTGP